MSSKGISVIDLSDLRARNYPQCFLERNPFPSTAVPEEVPVVTVDREGTKRDFKDAVTHLYYDRGSIVMVLVGDYGSGKSHLLRLFKHSVNSQLSHVDKPILAIYIKSPGRSLVDFFSTLVENLSRPFLTELSRKIVTDYILANRSRASRHIYDKDIRKKFEENQIPPSTFPDLLMKASTVYDLVSAIREDRFTHVVARDLVSAFLFLAHPDYSSLAWRWLLGARLSRDEQKTIAVDGVIDTSKEAETMLQSMIALLRSLGYESLVLLVDEFEKIVLVPAVQRARYQDDLRHLIDDNPKGIGFVFAIAPAQWQQLTSEPTALIRRLAGSIRMLDKFDEERVRELVAAYLHISRTKEYSAERAKKAFPKCEPKYCPFTPDSIKSVLDKTNGLVSSVIQLCRKTLDFFIDGIGKYDAINDELVSVVAKQEGLQGGS